MGFSINSPGGYEGTCQTLELYSRGGVEKLTEFGLSPHSKGTKDTVRLKYEVCSDIRQRNFPFVPEE